MVYRACSGESLLSSTDSKDMVDSEAEISSRNGIYKKCAVETAEKRTLRLEAKRRRYQLARAEETAEDRKERLKKRSEKDRAKRAKERQERQDKNRAGLPALQQCRETADEREVTVFALFQHKSKVNTETLPALQLHDSRISLETESQRESRLQQQRAYHCSKKEEESELDRLEHANQLKHLRLPAETDKEPFPRSLEEQEVQDAMRSFHQEMSSIQTPTLMQGKISWNTS